MIKMIQIAMLAGVLSACAAGGVSGNGNGSAGASDVQMVDAVTRKPEKAALALAPVPPAEAEPQPLPGAVPVYSGAPVEQVIDPNLNPATARSYNATWQDGGFEHRSVMFPHVIDGCKVMIQSRRTLDYVSGASGEFFEREGPDCNCDLVIDGFEDVFAQLNDEYKTPRMYDVCVGPGVDGATRQLEIMRETLKENRNFDKMKNVEEF